MEPNKIWLDHHLFEVVDQIPLGYEIWNIGNNMIKGYIPFCRLKANQPFNGAKCIEADTLKAMKVEGVDVVLKAVMHGPKTIKQMKEFINTQKERTAEINDVKKALEILYTLKH